MKGVTTVESNTLFKGHKHGKDIIAALLDAKLSANIFVRRVSTMSINLTEQPKSGPSTCKYFSVKIADCVHYTDVQ